MKRSRFSEEQIIGILQEHPAGLSARELCRKHGISDATFCKWRAKFGGMEVSEATAKSGLNALLHQLFFCRSPCFFVVKCQDVKFTRPPTRCGFQPAASSYVLTWSLK
jgi:hypothetical protein